MNKLTVYLYIIFSEEVMRLNFDYNDPLIAAVRKETRFMTGEEFLSTEAEEDMLNMTAVMMTMILTLKDI